MNEGISALIDGELEDAEAHRQIAAVKNEAELREAWNTYHLIGDAIRGHLAPDLSRKVVSRLEREPVVMAPSAAPSTREAARRWSISVAAGAAAVALVAWVAQPMVTGQSQVAQAPTSMPVAAQSAPRASGGSQGSQAVSSAAVANYLLAHQPYSASSAMQGVVPYARTVTHDTEGQR